MPTTRWMITTPRLGHVGDRIADGDFLRGLLFDRDDHALFERRLHAPGAHLIEAVAERMEAHVEGGEEYYGTDCKGQEDTAGPTEQSPPSGWRGLIERFHVRPVLLSHWASR